MKSQRKIIKINDYTTAIECDKCKRYVETQFGDTEIPFADNGCKLNIIGGHGLFHDDYDNKIDMDILLCHDCTLDLFRSIPKLNGIGSLHSVKVTNQSYPLCCEYSWGISEGKIIHGTKENFKPQKKYGIEK